MLYLIGTIIEIVVLIMSVFAPALYTQNFEYGKVTGVGKVYNEGDKVNYDLFSIMGVWAIIVVVLIGISAIIFLVLYFKKQAHQIPGFVIAIVYSMPLLILIIGRIALGSETKAMQSEYAIYAEGYRSGFTGLGWVILLLMLGAIGCSIAGAINQRINMESNPTTTTVQVNNNKDSRPKKDVKEDDFKI